MIIEKDKMISLEYVLREDNDGSSVIEEVNTDNPLKFVFGAGQMLPHFESNIENLKQDAKFDFKLSASEAYGEKREEMIVDIPLSIFEVDGKIDEDLVKIGSQVPMADAQGNRLTGIVLSLAEKDVKMDFNHPMAGTALHFTGRIVEVREATDEEKNMYQANGCSSCGTQETCSGSC